jgi:hypothetical protein
VIEIGLDYDAEHLANDAKKLINSKPRHGYLIHLVREFARGGPPNRFCWASKLNSESRRPMDG